jgi:hypothetical protein
VSASSLGELEAGGALELAGPGQLLERLAGAVEGRGAGVGRGLGDGGDRVAEALAGPLDGGGGRHDAVAVLGGFVERALVGEAGDDVAGELGELGRGGSNVTVNGMVMVSGFMLGLLLRLRVRVLRRWVWARARNRARRGRRERGPRGRRGGGGCCR